ncbi:hypothetical protein HIM_04174 [Hirsutella minnesotensis 3608]|uniref:FAD-binding PCMH-type domain-containing protein n=1 Tax=Hirsutella minnesotensis 3608 TaxID=1043627 RepID=A0A0F7ZQ12_9HYPO|nr:hypothetical protein HIM_04174 [Hirsutella minnesotensis 3608]
MGNSTSSPFQQCLDDICLGRAGCVSYPGNLLYEPLWVKPYNLAVVVEPVAVIRPYNSIEVSKAVTCAVKHGISVQARSGGHSFANHGNGGQNGELMIDLMHLQEFRMTLGHRAIIGGGMHLGDLDKKLHEYGRAIPHGTCPGVGIGGHATVGGLGPSSRMWGNMLDNVVQAKVVTATGRIVHVDAQNFPDLFWALRGAGASFGIVTEFTVQTYPSPDKIVEYSYHIKLGRRTDLVEPFEKWQELAMDERLDRRFSSSFIITPLGGIISGTFYGNSSEYRKTGIAKRLPDGHLFDIRVKDWLGHVAHAVEVAALHLLTDIPTQFYTKSVGLGQQDKLDWRTVRNVFNYMDRPEASLMAWAVIFNTEGGAVADVPQNETAYAHRDKVMMYQSYLVDAFGVSAKDRGFLDNLHKLVRRAIRYPGSVYPGYVDRTMSRIEAQEAYWGGLLPRLQQTKQIWDPDDVFRNPHSVQPIAAVAAARHLKNNEWDKMVTEWRNHQKGGDDYDDD